MDCAISHVVGHDSPTLTILHNQVQSEILNKEYAIIAQSSSKEGVKHRMSSPIGDSAASVGLAAGTEVFGLPSEGSLINFPFFCSAERHTV